MTLMFDATTPLATLKRPKMRVRIDIDIERYMPSLEEERVLCARDAGARGEEDALLERGNDIVRAQRALDVPSSTNHHLILELPSIESPWRTAETSSEAMRAGDPLRSVKRVLPEDELSAVDDCDTMTTQEMCDLWTLCKAAEHCSESTPETKTPKFKWTEEMDRYISQWLEKHGSAWKKLVPWFNDAFCVSQNEDSLRLHYGRLLVKQKRQGETRWCIPKRTNSSRGIKRARKDTNEVGMGADPAALTALTAPESPHIMLSADAVVWVHE